jgi:pectin methylesterase-like acyl-CoA thioesterase
LNHRTVGANWMNLVKATIALAALVMMVACESTPAVSAKSEAKPGATTGAKPAVSAEAAKAVVPEGKLPAVAPETTSWTGVGQKDSSTFYAAGPAWQLQYKSEAGAAGAATEFQIFVQRADTGRMLSLAVNQHGAAEGTVTVTSPPGTYFLRILAPGTWQASVSGLIPAPATAKVP